MTSNLVTSSTLVLAVAAAALLGACSRNDSDDMRNGARTSDGSTSQQTSPPVATTASRASEPGSSVAGDMAITASVKARLAADTELSALAINVDTNAGRVSLRGTAPDSAALTRATELVRAVDGVVGVDNGLTVQVSAR